MAYHVTVLNTNNDIIPRRIDDNFTAIVGGTQSLTSATISVLSATTGTITSLNSTAANITNLTLSSATINGYYMVQSSATVTTAVQNLYLAATSGGATTTRLNAVPVVINGTVYNILKVG